MKRAGQSEDNNCETLRLFAGLACTGLPKVDALLEELQTIAPQLQHGMQVVPRENLHITLKFLGSTDHSSVAPIAAVMDRITAATAPITLTLTGAGAFPSALWLGISPPKVLNGLASLIDEHLRLLGFEAESRVYVPHLTLARLRQPAGPELKAWIEQRHNESWGGLHIRAIHLYQSQTSAVGMSYSILHTAFLSRPD